MIAAGTGNVDVLCYIVSIDPYLVAVENKVHGRVWGVKGGYRGGLKRDGEGTQSMQGMYWEGTGGGWGTGDGKCLKYVRSRAKRYRGDTGEVQE